MFNYKNISNLFQIFSISENKIVCALALVKIFSDCMGYTLVAESITIHIKLSLVAFILS